MKLYSQIFSIFLFTGSLYAQNGVVANSVTKKPIANVANQLKEKSELRDTVLMNQKAIHLNEVVVKPENLTQLGYFRSKRNYFSRLFSHSDIHSFNSWLKPKNELILSTVPEEHYRNKKIQKLYIPLFGTLLLYNKIDPNNKNHISLFRLNIYQNQNGIPSNKIYASNPIEFVASKSNELYVDLSDENILWDIDGLSFGLELIGAVDENDERYSFLLPVITNFQMKGFSAKTYYRKSSLEKPVYYELDYDKKSFESRGWDVSNGLNLGLGIFVSDEK